MGQTSSLAQLRLRVIREADLQTQYGQSQTLQPDELTHYINSSYSELHDLLILRYGSNFFKRNGLISLVSGQDTYPLPDDFQKGIAVYWLVGIGLTAVRYEMQSFEERERGLLQSPSVVPYAYGQYLRYMYSDHNIEFVPIPNAGGTVEVRYVYQMPKLVNDNDTIESQIVAGWEEYIVVDAAIKCRDKLDLTTDRLGARKAGLMARITTVASDRDVGQPKRITNVRGRNRGGLGRGGIW